MANITGTPVFTQQMPTPPPFYQKFTKDNITRFYALKESGQPIPQDLEALEPPAPPENGWYRVFGAAYNVCVSRLCWAKLINRLTADWQHWPT
jgi:MED7 protein